MPEKPDELQDEFDANQGGLDEDQDYHPDPAALQIAVLAIRRRAGLLAPDDQVARDLIGYAEDYSELAALLERRSGRRGAAAAPEASFETETVFEIETFSGFMQRASLPSIDAELLRFRLAGKADPGPLAVVEVVRRPDGVCEELHAEVDPAQRRKGLATMLYDRIELVLGARLEPSGWLSEDAYAFWRSRRAEAVAGYRRVEPFHDLWISPGQLLTLMAIDRGKIEAWVESARDHAADRLH